MLYEEGKFQLSDPLDKYIPALKDLQVLAGMDGEVMRLEAPRRKPTIHDVFRHTAGFSYGFNRAGSDRSRIQRERHRLRHYHVAEAARRREPAEGPAALSSRRSVGLQRRARRAGLSGRVFFRNAVRRFCRDAHLRAARHDGRDVRRAEVSTCSATRRTMRRAIRRIRLHRSCCVETREGVPPRRLRRAAVRSGRLRALHGDSVRRLEHVVDGDGLRAFGQMLVNGGELDGTRLLGTKTVELMTMNNLPPNIPAISFGAPGLGSRRLGLRARRFGALDPARAGNLGSKGTFGWAGAASTWAILDPEEDHGADPHGAYMVAGLRFRRAFPDARVSSDRRLTAG